MVALKTTDPQSILKSASGKAEAFLVFGTDAGQIADLTKALGQRLAETSNPPGEIIRLTEQDLSATPGRLASEARSLPMFGGRPVILVKQAPQLTPALFEELLGGPPLAASIVVEAGNLKKDAKLRQIFEKAGNAAAIGCYGMDGRGLAQLIRDEIRAAGLTIAPDAAERLTQLLGADPSVARAELVKLVLYAAGEPQITLDHVEAIVGDASAHAFDAAIAQTLSGNIGAALKHLDGLAASGTSAAVFLTLLLSHLQKLHSVLAAMDRGESFDAAAARMRPPLHFRQKDAMKAQAARWRLLQLAGAIALAHETLRQTRLNPVLEHELVSHLIMRLGKPAAAQVV